MLSVLLKWRQRSNIVLARDLRKKKTHTVGLYKVGDGVTICVRVLVLTVCMKAYKSRVVFVVNLYLYIVELYIALQ